VRVTWTLPAGVQPVRRDFPTDETTAWVDARGSGMARCVATDESGNTASASGHIGKLKITAASVAGNLLTLTGGDFGETRGAQDAVYFGPKVEPLELNCPGAVWSPTRIVACLPAARLPAARSTARKGDGVEVRVQAGGALALGMVAP
jgi:hypothetical protein